MDIFTGTISLSTMGGKAGICLSLDQRGLANVDSNDIVTSIYYFFK